MNQTIQTIFWTLAALAVVIIILRMKNKGFFGKEESKTVEVKKE